MNEIKYNIEDTSLVEYLENLKQTDSPNDAKGVAFAELWGLSQNNQGEYQLVKVNITERSTYGSFVALANLMEAIGDAEKHFGLHLSRCYPNADSKTVSTANNVIKEITAKMELQNNDIEDNDVMLEPEL